VLDSKVEGVRGGSGKTFDWSLIKALKRTSHVILGGDWNPANVAQAIQETSPDWVDVASGVELFPGEKNAELMDAFIREVRRS